jgi:hypothetical protein
MNGALTNGDHHFMREYNNQIAVGGRGQGQVARRHSGESRACGGGMMSMSYVWGIT